MQLIRDKADRTSLMLSDFDMSIVDSASVDEKVGMVGTMGYTAPGDGTCVWSMIDSVVC